MGDPGHRELIRYLSTDAPKQLRLPDGSEPKALMVVTAHFEARNPTISAVEKPSLLFDYYGFPPETYEYKWPAPGSPAIAQKAAELLRSAGFSPELDTQRGNDHGVFVPLKLVYPNASIPVVQMSILSSFDPLDHLKLGQALAPLRDEGIAIVGSGMSFHNMREFMSSRMTGGGLQRNAPSAEFDAALTAAVEAEAGKRWELLKNWSAMPKARYAHPREEHLLPLLVCGGFERTH